MWAGVSSSFSRRRARKSGVGRQRAYISRTSSGIGTYESCVTSCSIIACGKIGAKASGPTGSIVAGFRGGSSWKGRSGTRLYQLSGMAFSSSRNFVLCTPYLRYSSCQHLSWSAYSFSPLGVRGPPQTTLPQAVALGDLDQELVVVADDPIDAEVDHMLHRRLVVDRVGYDFETLGLQPGHRRAVVVSRVLTQVPVLRNDSTLVGVVDLPVG